MPASKKKIKKTSPSKSSSKQKSGKKKTGKIIGLITGIAILLIIVSSVVFVLTNLNTIVKKAIEKYGSEAAQTPVRVKQVKISLKEGSGGIYGLSVGNPHGFEMPLAFYLGEAKVDIDPKSLTQEVKIIDDIIVDQPEIYVEINADNKNNLSEIQNNLPKAPKTPPKQEAQKTKPAKEPKLLIRHLRFSDGLIKAKVVKLNKEYEIKMPSFEMSHIGGPNGAAPTEITKQILSEITKRAIAEVRRKGVDQGVDELKKKASSQLDKEKDKAANKLKDEQRVCIELMYLEDHTYKEIAEITGYDLNKVKSHIQNGLRLF